MTYIRGLSTNRSFRGVDERFALRLGDEIKERIGVNPNLTVLDVVCGNLAEAITTLTQMYPSIRGVGVDYYLDSSVENPERLHLARGDLFHLPFKSFADVIYCAYVLADVFSLDVDEFKGKIADAVLQITSTLKVDGVAYIDEAVFSSASHNLEHLLEKINEKSPDFNKHYRLGNNPRIGLIGNYLICQKLD